MESFPTGPGKSPALSGPAPPVSGKLEPIGISSQAESVLSVSVLPTLENLGGPAALPSAVDELRTDKKRCNHPICKTRITILDRSCKCGHMFCSRHICAGRKNDDTSHKCPFDYKSEGAKLLAATNNRVAGEKLERI